MAQQLLRHPALRAPSDTQHGPPMNEGLAAFPHGEVRARPPQST